MNYYFYYTVFTPEQTMSSTPEDISKSLNDLPNQINVYGRFAFLERIIDGLESPRNLSFNDLYELWKNVGFFAELAELGFVQVSYNEGPKIDFQPSAKDYNRHQALALSCFVASIYANSSAEVSSPHERGATFTATFTRVSSDCIEYVNAYGVKVQFTFDPTKPSQFL